MYGTLMTREKLQRLLKGWITLFPALERVEFAELCAHKFGADTREVFCCELVAAIPTLRTVSFGSDVRRMLPNVAIAGADTQDQGGTRLEGREVLDGTMESPKPKDPDSRRSVFKFWRAK